MLLLPLLVALEQKVPLNKCLLRPPRNLSLRRLPLLPVDRGPQVAAWRRTRLPLLPVDRSPQVAAWGRTLLSTLPVDRGLQVIQLGLPLPLVDSGPQGTVVVERLRRDLVPVDRGPQG